MATVRKDDLDCIHDHSLNIKSRTIYVHSEPHFDDEIGVSFHMASKFIKNLDYLNSLSSDEIFVKFITVGGDWNYGMAMYDAIANSQSYVTAISFAHARSMSSIIIQAADTRLIHKHADFMVHYGTYGDEGDLREVMSSMDYYKKSNERMLDIYTDKCLSGQFATENKMKEKELKEYIRQQIEKKTAWWMSAEEALYYGFVDKVI